MTTIVVTGASGNVGSELLTLLDPRQDVVRAFVRQAPSEPLPGISYQIGDFADVATLDKALAGADALFLACANSPRQVEFECRVIDRAVRHGIGRVVKLSAFGAADDAPVAFWRWHAEIEGRLRASGLPQTVLRPYFFMSNLGPALLPAASMGMLFAPAGDARIAMIDPRDVAAVAARTLTGAAQTSSLLTLAGPEALTYSELAERLSQAVRRPVRYQEVSADAARDQMVGSGMPAFAVDQILTVFACLRQGMQAHADHGSLERFTGRSPRTLAGFLRDRAPADLLDTAGVADLRS